MARFGARCSPTAAPQRIRNKARFARLRGGVPTDQLRDAQPRKTAWQDRDKDRERQLSSHLAIRVGYWRCLCAEMSANGMARPCSYPVRRRGSLGNQQCKEPIPCYI